MIMEKKPKDPLRGSGRSGQLAILAVLPLGLMGEAVHELDPYTVVGGEASLFTLPGSGYRVEGPELEAFQVDDLTRLLKRVPGAYFREEDGYGLLANISLRGVDTSRSAKLTLMEDGIPTAPAPYSAPAAYYSPTVGRMASVEILKGTSQVRFGPHTTGGVIHYRSTPLPGESAGKVELAAGGDAEMRAHAWLGDRWETEGGTLQALAEGYHRQTDGFRRIAAAGAYPGSEETGFRRTDSMLKLGWTSPDRKQTLVGKVGYTDLDARISYLGQANADFAADPFRRYAASREDNLRSYQGRSFLRYGLLFNEDWELSWTGYYNHFHRNWYKLHDIRDLDGDGDGLVEGAVGGDPVRVGLSAALAGAEENAALEALRGERAAVFRVRANNRDYSLAGSELTLTTRMEAGEWRHSPLLGIRYHEDRIRRFQWHDLYEQAEDGSWSAPERSAPGSDGNRRQHTAALALFLEDEISRGPWLLRPGFRYEWIDYTYEPFSTDGSNQRLDRLGERMEVWSAGLAATYRLNESTALFGNAYRGYSVPDPRSAITRDVVEESSLSAEAGFRYQPAEGRLSAEAVVFTTAYDDLIVIDNIGSGTSDGNADRAATENVGEVNSYGLEWLLQTELSPEGTPDWRLPVTLTATWTVAELDGPSRSLDAESIFAGGEDGSRVPYIPEWQLHLSIAYERDAFSTGLSMAWRDSTFTTATETAAPVNPVTGEPDARYGKIPSVFTVDWQATVRLGSRIELFGTVKNLLDREYVVSRHPHGARAGSPRQVLGGVRWRF